MLTKLFTHVENYMIAFSFFTFLFLASYWHDGVQNLTYWENYSGLSSQTLLITCGVLLIVSVIINKILRGKSTLQIGVLLSYVSVIIVLTALVMITCLQTPFIQPQWQSDILPPPTYDNWNNHMLSISYMVLIIICLHILYIIYSLFRLILVPPVQNMIIAEA